MPSWDKSSIALWLWVQEHETWDGVCMANYGFDLFIAIEVKEP